MKKQKKNSIVTVEVRNVGPREFEARALVEWLKTLPYGEGEDNDAYRKALDNATIRGGVRTLSVLANYLFDIRIKDSAYDFLRVYACTTEYTVTYMEHYDEGTPGLFFNAVCTQCFDHVVDAFVCLKNRYTSEQPAKAVYHANH